MAIVIPTGMIHNWIQTNALELHALVECGPRFGADITKPRRTQFIFNSGFGDKERALVTRIHFFDYSPKRTVTRIVLRDKAGTENPLVMHVVVPADDVQVLRGAPK